MSMTVHIAMKGITELEVLLEALREMGLAPERTLDTEPRGRLKHTLAYCRIDGHMVGFSRNPDGELTIMGDNEWNIIRRGNKFRQKLQQFYSLAVVKRKARELRYNIASVDMLEDGSIKVIARAWG